MFGLYSPNQSPEQTLPKPDPQSMSQGIIPLAQAYVFHFPLRCLTVSPRKFSTKDGSVLQNGCHYKDHLLQVLNTKTNTKQLGMERDRLGPKTHMEQKSSG